MASIVASNIHDLDEVQIPIAPEFTLDDIISGAEGLGLVAEPRCLIKTKDPNKANP